MTISSLHTIASDRSPSWELDTVWWVYFIFRDWLGACFGLWCILKKILKKCFNPTRTLLLDFWCINLINIKIMIVGATRNCYGLIREYNHFWHWKYIVKSRYAITWHHRLSCNSPSVIYIQLRQYIFYHMTMMKNWLKDVLRGKLRKSIFPHH